MVSAPGLTPPGTGAVLDVVGESAAGQGFSGSVAPGTAARIFTGAPVPRGADRVNTGWLARHLASTARADDSPFRAVGFGSAATLRHHFGRILKTTPTRYRARFRTTS